MAGVAISTSVATTRPGPSDRLHNVWHTMPWIAPASCVRTWACWFGGKTSMMRSTVCAASCVCRVAKTRWPVSAAVRATEIVSRSRISPTRMMSGSCRSTCLSALANDSVSAPTSRWFNQREVGADTLSFASALKHVLRQDPDIILVGEMRDLETISVALTAAETGHLVFATLHTQDAAQTVDRIIDVFPPNQQAQVRTQLAGAIQGIVSQTLCKRSDGPGRVVATEVLIATPAIRNLIREGKTHQIYSSMQAGAKQGMHTMDQHLAELVKVGKITYEVALEKCHHVADFNRLTGRSAGGSGTGSSLGAMSGGLGDPLGSAGGVPRPGYSGQQPGGAGGPQ